MSSAQPSLSLTPEEREMLRLSASLDRDRAAKARRLQDEKVKSSKRKKRLQRRELRKRART